jgi:nitrogen fixation protein NifT
MTRSRYFGNEKRPMKVMIRKNAAGELSAYIAKKDLEEPIVNVEKEQMWGGRVTLANGWQLELPAMSPETTLPVTVEARRLSE